MKFYNFNEYSEGIKLGYLFTILYPNYIKFSPLNGGSRQQIKCSTQPIAQMSIFQSYGCYLTNSGAKYKGVPTLVPYYAKWLDTTLDTPKSPNYDFKIFKFTLIYLYLSVKNIFNALISL